MVLAEAKAALRGSAVRFGSIRCGNLDVQCTPRFGSIRVRQLHHPIRFDSIRSQFDSIRFNSCAANSCVDSVRFDSSFSSIVTDCACNRQGYGHCKISTNFTSMGTEVRSASNMDQQSMNKNELCNLLKQNDAQSGNSGKAAAKQNQTHGPQPCQLNSNNNNHVRTGLHSCMQMTQYKLCLEQNCASTFMAQSNQDHRQQQPFVPWNLLHAQNASSNT